MKRYSSQNDGLLDTERKILCYNADGLLEVQPRVNMIYRVYYVYTRYIQYIPHRDSISYNSVLCKLFSTSC